MKVGSPAGVMQRRCHIVYDSWQFGASLLVNLQTSKEAEEQEQTDSLPSNDLQPDTHHREPIFQHLKFPIHLGHPRHPTQRRVVVQL